MVRTVHLLLCAFMIGKSFESHAQSPKEIVQQAVETELAAARDDHTHWLYFESNRDQKYAVGQWVAEAQTATVKRVIQRNGLAVPEAQQRQEMDTFINDAKAQTRQHRSIDSDNEKAAQLLKLLPNAFIWTNREAQGRSILLHFRPDPEFHPPDMEARVFAAMDGDMAVDMEQHRIVSLKGRMIRDVKFFGGLFGELKAGGAFDVERREIGQGNWQITETHVHIQGHALIFKNISVYQDDEKSKFRQIPANISLQQAESELLKIGN